MAITLLCTLVFPLLQPKCLPQGKLPPANTTFAMTGLFLPRNGPDHWKKRDVEMLKLSEENKMAYCQHQVEKQRNRIDSKGDKDEKGRQQQKCSYINGTAWAERNYAAGAHLDHIKGPERGVWFKPIYLREMLRTVQNDTTVSSNKNESSVPKGVDWILYMDSDIIIINHDFDLRLLLAGTEPDDALIISPDAENRVNTGALLIRNNDLGRMIVEAWVGDEEAMDKAMDQAFLADTFDEDGYMREQYLPKGRSYQEMEQKRQRQRPRMKIVWQCALQSGGGLEGTPKGPYFEGTYARGDFAVHFFGRPDKLEQMTIASEGSIGFLSQ